MSFWANRRNQVGDHVHVPSQILDEETGEPSSGGSSWLGPFEFAAASYADLGNGWTGILIDVDLTVGGYVLAIGLMVDEEFDNTDGGLWPNVGDLAGEALNTVVPFSAIPSDYLDTMRIVDMATRGGGSVSTRGAVLVGSETSVFVNNFVAPPTEGSGRLWIQVIA